MKIFFTGLGNEVKLEVPVRVTSRIDKSLPKGDINTALNGPGAPAPELDLPPYVGRSCCCLYGTLTRV